MSMASGERSGPTEVQLRRLSGLALLTALPLQVLGLALHPPGEELEHVVRGAYGPAHLVLAMSSCTVLARAARAVASAGRPG